MALAISECRWRAKAPTVTADLRWRGRCNVRLVVTSVCHGNVELYAVGMVLAIGQVAQLNRRLHSTGVVRSKLNLNYVGAPWVVYRSGRQLVQLQKTL